MKKLEGLMKKEEFGLTDSEVEEPEVQGRKSQDDPLDSSVQGLVTPPTAKVNTSGEEQGKEIQDKKERQRKGEEGKEGSLNLAFSKKKFDAGAEQLIQLVLNKLVPGKNKLVLFGTRGVHFSQDKGQREGKAPMLSEETLKNTKNCRRRKLNEQQKKRKAQVQFEAQHYTNEDWDLIRAKIEANAELSKSMLGSELPIEKLQRKWMICESRKKYYG
ncbi:hypothetical protein Tco_0479064 [Tanacetum coccineum]